MCVLNFAQTIVVVRRFTACDHTESSMVCLWSWFAVEGSLHPIVMRLRVEIVLFAALFTLL